jgi:hypothetical protein
MSKSVIHKILFKSALPWALGVLIILELFLHTSVLWQLPVVREIRNSERIFEAARERSPNPVIVILGSSRLQNAVIPEVMETELGLRSGDVANLSFPATTPQDFLHLYKSEREYLSNVDLMVYEVGEFQYNWSAIADETAGNMSYRKLSDLSTRLKSPGFKNKVDYGLGFFVQIWDARFVVREVMSSVVYGSFSFTEIPITVEPGGRVGIDQDLAISEYDPESSDQLAAFGYRNFEISEYQLDAMAELLKLARQDGISIVMIPAPFNVGFEAIVENNYAEYNQMWRSRVAERSGTPIAKVNLTAPDCSDWKKCYWDIGHVNSIGANNFSVALAEYLGGKDYHSTRTTRVLTSEND